MRLTVAPLIGLLALLQPAHGADNGRFEIAPGPPIILLDTLSGKTWRYDKNGQWKPINLLKSEPSSQLNEPPRQRRQRESDERRLRLNKSGVQPKPKSPARSLLETLAPAK